jgi:hypothetical protein
MPLDTDVSTSKGSRMGRGGHDATHLDLKDPLGWRFSSLRKTRLRG